MTVVWALTWLCQCAALATLTAAFVRLPGIRMRASTRHAAWTLTLLVFAALLVWPVLPDALGPPAPSLAPEAAGAAVAGSVPSIALPAPLVGGFWWFGWAWALGTAVGLASIARDVWRIALLKQRTTPLSTEEQTRWASCLSAWVSRRAPRLAWCDELDSPAVLGFCDPVIALPRSQMLHLADEPSRLVVLHELAHVRRRDDWWVLAERVVLALTWINPVVHWVRRQISLSREMACDAWVVAQTSAPVAYATCLADVAELRTRLRRPRLAAAVTGRPTMLRRRIVGVLECGHRPPTRAAGVVAWLTPVSVCVIAAALVQLPPVFVVAPLPDAVLGGLVRTAPAGLSAHTPVGVPASPLVRVAPLSSPRRPASGRRLSATPTPAPVVDGAEGSVGNAAPEAQDAAAGQLDAVPDQPLAARPLIEIGAPGVTIPAAGGGSVPPQQVTEREWWGRAPALATAAGSGVATAGRRTASFFTRIGSHVPQLFTR